MSISHVEGLFNLSWCETVESWPSIDVTVQHWHTRNLWLLWSHCNESVCGSACVSNQSNNEKRSREPGSWTSCIIGSLFKHFFKSQLSYFTSWSDKMFLLCMKLYKCQRIISLVDQRNSWRVTEINHFPIFHFSALIKAGWKRAQLLPRGLQTSSTLARHFWGSRIAGCSLYLFVCWEKCEF